MSETLIDLACLEFILQGMQERCIIHPFCGYLTVSAFYFLGNRVSMIFACLSSNHEGGT